MNKWFKEVRTVEELRKQYRELLKKYHPDNDGGSVEITQEINAGHSVLLESAGIPMDISESFLSNSPCVI